MFDFLVGYITIFLSVRMERSGVLNEGPSELLLFLFSACVGGVLKGVTRATGPGGSSRRRTT